uniref:Uncharacterized protein n=1 Tax=Siphoviridae sp. ct5jB2 TaxID=2825337 RepID=A0A8S5TTH7_9CAUD|nr:MAG TPA: hypothetical protein [Siphoviridae sp. ct5jB2]
MRLHFRQAHDFPTISPPIISIIRSRNKQVAYNFLCRSN